MLKLKVRVGQVDVEGERRSRVEGRTLTEGFYLELGFCSDGANVRLGLRLSEQRVAREGGLLHEITCSTAEYTRIGSEARKGG